MITHFPPAFQPRAGQHKAVEAIERAIESGKRFVVVEAPVGLGKSQVAATVGNWSGSAYVTMPRKSLQGQYRDTFEGDVRLVKGRASMPCTFNKPELNRKVIQWISTGQNIPQPELHHSCSTAPCQGVRQPTKTKVLEECAVSGQCPYQAMIDEACKHKVVVTNHHALFFGGQNGNLPKRRVLVIDEAHTLEPLLRDLMTVQFTVYRKVVETELIGMQSPAHFADFLKRDEQFRTVPRDGQEGYLARLEKFERGGESVYGKQAIVKVVPERNKTTFEFIPAYVGNAAHSFFFDLADIVVFMTGTVYGVDIFLKGLGIKTIDSSFTRLDSDFPPENRPVVRPRKAGLDLSHKHIDDNFDAAVAEIKRLMVHHKDHKGLIHAPNYKLAVRLSQALQESGRVMTHGTEDFLKKLQAFYDSDEPKVFISPSVREGVDFSGDKARWQVILRPPYPPAMEPYYKSLMAQNRWNEYYRLAAIDFGQMLGRIVRSSDDCGVTYLLSNTFDAFLSKTWVLYPDWLKKGFVK